MYNSCDTRIKPPHRCPTCDSVMEIFTSTISLSMSARVNNVPAFRCPGCLYIYFSPIVQWLFRYRMLFPVHSYVARYDYEEFLVENLKEEANANDRP